MTMTQLLGVHAIAAPRYCDSQLDLKLASEISSLYSPQHDWPCPLRGSQPSMTPPTTTSYIDFSAPTLPSSDGQFRHDSMFHHNRFSNHHDDLSRKHAPQPAYTNFIPTQHTAATTMNLGYTPTIPYTAPSLFTATNSTTPVQHATTMSPLVTQFDTHGSSPLDGHAHSAESLDFAPLAADNDRPPSKRRRRNSQMSAEAHSPTESVSSAGRRRKSEYAEPGSARAIYLEKNRKAASKCRNKQKRQQDDLVEMAREVERRNRFLKAEVELLQAGMRELMDVVGKHNHCSDTRLSSYVQREANRLAAGNQRTGIFSTPLKSSSSDGTSPRKSSSP